MKNNELESENKTNEGINAQSSESLSNFLIHQKLTSIETKLSESINPIMLSIVELIKSVLLGWPALGIIFLLLFQDPIGKILEVLPKKLLSAKNRNYTRTRRLEAKFQQNGAPRPPCQILPWRASPPHTPPN